MGTNTQLAENMVLELRRGALVLAVLSQMHTPQYGYSLKQALTDKGMTINEGTLYPLLRRLEKQGLLDSDWQVIDDARPRRYYQLSQLGKEMMHTLSLEWYAITEVMDQLLNEATKELKS